MSVFENVKKYFGHGENEGGNKEFLLAAQNVQADIEQENEDACAADIRKLCAALNNTDMDEDTEWELMNVLGQLSAEQDKAWFRKLFREFLSFLEKDYYLTTDLMKLAVLAAWSSNETYDFEQDGRLDPLLKSGLPEIADSFFLLDEEEPADAEKEKVKVQLRLEEYSVRWYLARYFLRAPGAFKYMKDHYPHIAVTISDLIEECSDDPCAYEQKVEEKLLQCFADKARMDAEGSGEDPEKKAAEVQIFYLRTNLLRRYYHNLQELFPEEKEALLQEEQLWENVHANDMCPCGSGRKYKKCHGRG